METYTKNEEKRADMSEVLKAAQFPAFEELDDATFGNIGALIRSKCGITLGMKKKPLVSARIRKRMLALGLSSPAQYFEHVVSDGTGVELMILVDSMATNVTSFFREKVHFSILHRYVRALALKSPGKMRFWSAACSTGEETYSMAFTVRDAAGDCGADIKILASDISTSALGRATAGCYTEDKLSAVPGRFVERYFEGGKAGQARVKQEIKEMMLFRRINLADMPYPLKNRVDAIFCRNVMIYFDRELKAAMIGEFYRLLKPGGMLFLGLTESLVETHSGMRKAGPSVYIKQF